jgi:uncharacterized OB-fold protein
VSDTSFDPKTAFPVPVPDADTQPFWDGCNRGELLIQRCGTCEKWLWQPRPICSSCQTPDPAWTRVSGDGFVASWMVARPPTLPAHADKVPYVILLAELNEGVRLIGYLVDSSGQILQTDGTTEGIEIGTRIALRFHDQAGTILPSWTVQA